MGEKSRILGRERWAMITGAAAMVLSMGPAATAQTPEFPAGVTERVSISTEAEQAGGASGFAAVSADGRYIAFHSQAPDLVPGDTNGEFDVFVHDRRTGITELVSVASDGTHGNDRSLNPDISADGRFVAFHSRSTNLVAGDGNAQFDVFVRDRATGLTERVSVGNDGAEASSFSFNASLSDDGRFVSFESQGPNLVPEDANASRDIFVRDRETETTEIVSIASDGGQGEANSDLAAISADGRYVVFQSRANNLVEDDTNETCDPDEGCQNNVDAFIHDRQTGVTERVSLGDEGQQGDTGGAFLPSVSADGRYVAFYSFAESLVPEHARDPNGDWRRFAFVYVRDRANDRTEAISLSVDDGPPNGGSVNGAISADGRYVAYYSNASNLVHDDTTSLFDIFLRDREDQTTERISVATDGSGANGFRNFHPDVSSDGGVVVFESDATNLDPADDTNGVIDVFVRDRSVDPFGGGSVVIVGLEAAVVDAGARVSGQALFRPREVTGADDSPEDGVPGAHLAGAELTGAALIHRVGQRELDIRLDLAPPADNTMPGPGIVFGLSFSMEGARFEVRAVKAGATASPPASPAFALYRCEEVCTEQARLDGAFEEGGFGLERHAVRIVLPLAALAIDSEQALLTDVVGFSATGELDVGGLAVLDAVEMADASLDVPEVRLAIEQAGTAEDDVAFDFTGRLEEDGRFSELVSLPSGEDALRAWARVCLVGECAIASTPLLKSPEPEQTTVTFTERSETSGQFSDEALFEARLTDSDGDPIEGATLTFALTDEESSRDFTATTDADGVASVTPILEEKPGPHELDVRYDGDDDRAASAATQSFVVEKEDTHLELTVQGEDDDRTLNARLSDLDTSSDGVADRTIDFYSDDELIGSVVTDANGVASLPVPPVHRGNNRTYEAVFDGDGFYLGSSDERAGKGKGGNGGGNDTADTGATYAGKALLM